jgi:hypothetical protein
MGGRRFSSEVSMPVELRINHPDRIVIGVASGILSITDLKEFVRQLKARDVTGYRKIIDLMAATPAISENEVPPFSRWLGEALANAKCGPLAVVVPADAPLDSLAKMFVSMAGPDLMAKVFHSIHEARQWLSLHTALPTASSQLKTG